MVGGKDELETVKEGTADYDEMERYRETQGMGHSALVTKALEAFFGRAMRFAREVGNEGFS